MFVRRWSMEILVQEWLFLLTSSEDISTRFASLQSFCSIPTGDIRRGAARAEVTHSALLSLQSPP
jgi:hypothetical protein